jgi:hypothetical protein
MIKQLVCSTGVAFAALPANALVATFDFDKFSNGTNISGTRLGEAVFSAGSNEVIVDSGTIASSPYYRVDFGYFGVFQVSVDVATMASGPSDFLMQAFSDTDILLGESSGSGTGMTLSVFAPSLRYIEISGSEMISADNFLVSHTSVGPIHTPVPGALPLMATGVAGAVYLGVRRYRADRQASSA